MDIFWVVFPNQDPVKLFEKYGKRWELVHLKDMKKETQTGALTGSTDVKNDAALGRGYDYDVTNSDVILNRLSVKDGRLVLPDGTSYAILVLPSGEDAHPAVLEKIEQLLTAQGSSVVTGNKLLRGQCAHAPSSAAKLGTSLK